MRLGSGQRASRRSRWDGAATPRKIARHALQVGDDLKVQVGRPAAVLVLLTDRAEPVAAMKPRPGPSPSSDRRLRWPYRVKKGMPSRRCSRMIVGP